MLSPEETKRIASQALSSKDVGQITLVPHDQGSFTQAGRLYNWRSYHMPQVGLFVLVRRAYDGQQLQFVSVPDVFALTRATSSLKEDLEPALEWKTVS